MYEIIRDVQSYLDNIPGLVVLIVGYLLAVAIFVFVVNPVHNYVKYRVAVGCGDSRIKGEGFLTMAPHMSFHWIGTFSALVLQMGFASPVIHDREKFKRPILGTIFMALSGILTYLLFAFVALFFYAVLNSIGAFGISSAYVPPMDAGFFAYIYYAVFAMFNFLTKICLYSSVFNLIPLVPMDMGDVLYMFMNTRWTDALRNNEILVGTALFIFAFFTIGQPDGAIIDICKDILVFVINSVYTPVINAVVSIFA